MSVIVFRKMSGFSMALRRVKVSLLVLKDRLNFVITGKKTQDPLTLNEYLRMTLGTVYSTIKERYHFVPYRVFTICAYNAVKLVDGKGFNLGLPYYWYINGVEISWPDLNNKMETVGWEVLYEPTSYLESVVN